MSLSFETTLAPTNTLSLSYDRTVERQRVHRTAVSEVFLTDAQRYQETGVLVAAQLPSSHSFFHDHIDRDAVDPLLFLEIARQATLASAHELGVDVSSVLISNEFELRLDVDAIHGLDPSETNVLVENRFEWTTVRRGVARAGRCDQRLIVGERVVAEHWSSGRILTRPQLAVLRSEFRGTPPPTSAKLIDSLPDNPVMPHLVGRSNPLNVVISNLCRAEDLLRASISPRLSNRALFDHSYDHVTMQVLTEAARQMHVAELLESERVHEISSIRGSFQAFAELDEELVITSSRVGQYSIQQHDRQVAEFILGGLSEPAEKRK